MGGGVVNVQTAGGETVYSADVARLSGVVIDNHGERRLAGATVSLAGTNYSTMTDEAGRFVLSGFIDGEYAVAYSHPWLDSMGFGYFLVENWVITTAGVLVGVVLATGLNYWLVTAYELEVMSWFYVPLGILSLWSVGLLAVLGPARRAARVSPAIATRTV